jgi:preprotein translocase subunit SecD
MKNSLAWRGALVVSVVALAAWAAYPLREKINLGLDLRGGIHLVLAVDLDDALEAEAEYDADRLARQLADEDVAGVTTSLTGPNTFIARGIPAGEERTLRDVVEDFLPGWDMTRSGEEVRFVRRTDAVDQIGDQAVRQALVTIRNRVDAFGVAEPVIQRQGLGGNRIVLQLPGIDDPERVKELIKSTALLEFRLVAYPDSGGPALDREAILAHYGGVLPDTVEVFEQDLVDRDGVVTGTGYWAL